MTNIAFHNDPAIKAKYQARLSAHRNAEQLVQGQGFDRNSGKGCAVGCTLDNYDHTRYPIELGLPEWLARLEDRIFEGLLKHKAEKFAEDFLAVIPIGADVSKVRGELAILRHTRDLVRLESNTEPYADRVRTAIREVIDWIVNGEQESAAESAWSAAWSARSTAWSAAWSAARSAEWSAESARSAESAAWSAESAARSAEWSAESARSAESAAWSAESAAEHFEWEAETLLKLLSESPCVNHT